MLPIRSLIPLLLGLPSMAQPCHLVLSGRVLDDHDGTALAYAEVRLEEAGLSAQADAQGAYRITGICPGEHTLRVAHLGCEPATVKLRIERDVQRDLFLEHHEQELRDLEVVRDRPDENVGLSRVEIDRAAREQGTGATIVDVLKAVPGVTVLSAGPTIGKPVIHGLYGNRVLILNQGVRQEDQQWGTEHAPNLDPFAADRVEVVKGAASVQYGADAMGGVVVTTPAPVPREGGLSGEVRGAGLWNGRGGAFNGQLQGTVPGLRGAGWRVQGGARLLGDSEAPDHVLSNTGVREAGMSAALGWHRHRGGLDLNYSWFARELGIMRASHIGNLTDLEAAIERQEPWYVAPFTYAIAAPRQTVQHHLLRSEATYRTSDRAELVLTYAYQADDRQEFDIRRAGRSERPAIDLFLTTHTADVVLKHYLGPHVHGKIGVNGLWQDNSNIPGTGVRPLIPDHRKRTAGVFVLEHFPISDRIELEAGARLEATGIDVWKYDANDVLLTPGHRFTNHAWSVGGNWAVRDSLVLRGGLSTAYRPPHVSELYSEGLHHGAAALEYGDPTLGSERMLKASLEMDGTWWQGRLRAVATVHASRIADFIYLRPDGYQLTIRGAFPSFRYVSTDAGMHGADLGLTMLLAGPWSLRGRWSLVRGRDLTADEWLFLMPADRGELGMAWSRRAAGRWRDIEAVLSGTIVLHQSRYPVGLDYMEPPAGYHLLGLSLGATLPVGRNELRFGLQGSNLLNTTYREYLDRFRYYADARGTDLVLWVRYAFGQGGRDR